MQNDLIIDLLTTNNNLLVEQFQYIVFSISVVAGLMIGSAFSFWKW